MANDNPQPSYGRAAEHIKGIGKSLESIAGRDVLLVDYEYTTRQMRGEDAGFVRLRISTDLTDPSAAEEYHAWSDALGEKMTDIPRGSLPLVANFSRTPTASGFRVWTIS